MDFFWEIFQEGRIANARRDAAEARTKAASSSADVAENTRKVHDLELAVDRLALASQAMWEILRSRFGITEEDLREKMTEIDLRDGKDDQRMTRRVIDCPQCGRTMNIRCERCLYCGAAVPRPMAFQ